MKLCDMRRGELSFIRSSDIGDWHPSAKWSYVMYHNSIPRTHGVLGRLPPWRARGTMAQRENTEIEL